MAHTPEQLDIIRRIGDTQKRFNEAIAEQGAISESAGQSMLATGHGLAVVAEALQRSMERLRLSMEKSNEIGTLNQQYGDLFREYLDTIITRSLDRP